MSVTYIPVGFRRTVIARAQGCCEYCRIPEDATALGCEVDHIIAEKHGGETTLENLAYSCTFCNRAKGSDLGSLKPGTREFIFFFNPRMQPWEEHFQFDQTDQITILPLTDTGEASIRLLGFNEEHRLLERQLVHELERFLETDDPF